MYQAGDLAIVISNKSRHGFEIGEKVRVLSLDGNGEVETCEHLDGSDQWWISEDELQRVEEDKP